MLPSCTISDTREYDTYISHDLSDPATFTHYTQVYASDPLEMSAYITMTPGQLLSMSLTHASYTHLVLISFQLVSRNLRATDRPRGVAAKYRNRLRTSCILILVLSNDHRAYLDESSM